MELLFNDVLEAGASSITTNDSSSNRDGSLQVVILTMEELPALEISFDDSSKDNGQTASKQYQCI